MAVPEHPSLLLPGEGSKHHLVSLPGCRSPRSSLQNGSVSLPDLLLLLLLPSPALPEQWRAVTRRGTPDPCWVLEEHQWGMPAGLPALAAPWLPAAAATGGGGGFLLNSPGSPRGGRGCRKVRFSFAPDLPAYIRGSCPDPTPGLAASTGSIPAPFFPCLRAAGGGRLPAPSPRAAGAAGARASLLHESWVIFSSLMCLLWLRRRLGRGSGSLPDEQGDALVPGPQPGVIWGQEMFFGDGEEHPCIMPSSRHPSRVTGTEGSGVLGGFGNQPLEWHPSPAVTPPSLGLPPRCRCPGRRLARQSDANTRARWPRPL